MDSSRFGRNHIYRTLNEKLSSLKYAVAMNIDNTIDFLNSDVEKIVKQAVKNFQLRYNVHVNSDQIVYTQPRR